MGKVALFGVSERSEATNQGSEGDKSENGGRVCLKSYERVKEHPNGDEGILRGGVYAE